ncbi:hypothetical protein R1flu_023239 [Riccia fluitans]|uniref:Uncharacterized protein n=1 Tax=Riccia fluitans TaxID=41844 RepID=A0ABD1XRM7_9MARC
MSYLDDTSSDEDSTTTIFSSSSQGSAISIMSKNSMDLAKMKTEIDNNSEVQRKEAIALVDSLLEQREKAEILLEEITKRPSRESYGDSDDTSLDEEELENSVQPEDSSGFCASTAEGFGKVSSKEMFRRMRQRLTKRQFRQFVRNIEELNKLREEREKRNYQSYMHPLIFSSWPHIFINVGEWETVPAVS